MMGLSEQLELGNENYGLTENAEVVSEGILHEILGSREASETTENVERNETGIIGNPEKDAELWHRQEHPMSCAVACQEYVAEGLLKDDFSEAKMRAYARNREWFSDEGTPMIHCGRLLEEMGLDVERELNADMSDIRSVLSNGGKVMVSVNNMALENPLYAAIPGFSANHMVQVIGIDERDRGNTEVILNDPGVENGGGRRVPLKVFEAAWGTGSNYLVSVFRGEGSDER